MMHGAARAEEPEDLDRTARLWRRWRVYLHSTSGHYAQYEGYVDISSYDEEPRVLFQHAVQQLRATAFPERSSDCWRFVSAQLWMEGREPPTDDILQGD